MDVQFDYEPINAKMREFHNSLARDKCLTGGFGCGKTYATSAEAIMLAMEYPNNEIDICRKTFGELDRSTRPVLQELLPPAIVKRPYSSADHRIELINGSYFQFFPLDEREKVKSLNSGVIVIDEASEIDEGTFLMLRARLRRPVPRRSLLIASNPTYTNHWLYKWFGQLSDGRFPDRFHRQLSTYENPTLPKDYITDLERNLPEDLFRVYVLGEWGHVTFGERIYAEFGPQLHGRSCHYNPDYPVLRGWDFGYLFPAVVFAQLDSKGRVRVLAELMGKNRLIDYFGEDVLTLGEKLFPGAKYEDYGDPAGAHKDPRGVTDRTAIQVLREKFSIQVRYRDVLIRQGLDLIRRYLARIIEGEPAIQVNRDSCPILMEGFSGGYACKQNKDGSLLRDEPKDDGYFEHLQDAFRSIMTNKFAWDMQKFEDRKRGIRPAYRPAFPGTSY